MFRIEDYELKASARNLKARPAMPERVVPDGENGLFEYPGAGVVPGTKADYERPLTPAAYRKSRSGQQAAYDRAFAAAMIRRLRGKDAADRAWQQRRDPGDLLVATGFADSGVSHTIRWQFLAAETEKQTVEAPPRYGCCGVRRCARSMSAPAG